ncbi:MAG: alpha/beta hydrolase [Citrobacter freundii]|nr:MAG: alpha/beta hydrolase [Citrobacter freundii]
MKRSLAMLTVFLTSKILLSQEVIPLYSKIPGGKPAVAKERSDTTGGILRIRDVSVPTLTIYRPDEAKANGTAVVICPGGGYALLAAGHEGSDVAKLFTSWGITACVLKYRLPNDAIMENKTIGPLQDAQTALALVRKHASEWKLDPAKIGIMGFSAGGHLAATASTHFNKPVIAADKLILRPSFSILIYPVISLTDSLMHKGSRDNLLGADLSPARVAEYSNELQVTPETPPAFLVHASDDKTVPVGNSIAYYQALLKNNVSAEMHIYEKGGHGFGMNNKTTADQWTERLKNWLMANKLLN